MATTIAPSIGAGVLFTQQGVGTSPGYSAIDDRRSDSMGLQEGIYGSSTLVTAGGVSNVANADFMVTQRNAGANMTVDINMPAGGFACVQGDSVSGQGLYVVPVHASTINEAVAAADPTNPRIDSVILEVLDNVHDASGSSLARVRVLTGQPNGTPATLNNRVGAPTLPGGALLLADILVAANATTIPNTVIRDRRKFARGGLFETSTTTQYTLATSMTEVDTTNFKPRFECSGAPLRIHLQASLESTLSGNLTTFGLFEDGAEKSGYRTRQHTSGANFDTAVSVSWEFAPAAGSHLYSPAAMCPATGTLRGVADLCRTFFTVEEISRQNSANNTVTTG